MLSCVLMRESASCQRKEQHVTDLAIIVGVIIIVASLDKDLVKSEHGNRIVLEGISVELSVFEVVLW
jgi:hypothetical protein